MCQHQQVYTTMCMCVSISQIFLKGYVSSQLDPNAYAQDIDLVTLDSQANCDCPSW
jgi:hypothetical protein